MLLVNITPQKQTNKRPISNSDPEFSSKCFTFYVTWGGNYTSKSGPVHQMPETMREEAPRHLYFSI